VTDRLERAQRFWERQGRRDPMRGVLARPESWEQDEFFATGATEIAAVMAYLDSLGMPEQRGRALDFGCGIGRLSRALAPHFEGVVGVDVAASMIERATDLNAAISNCEFVHNPSPDLHRFEDRSFDFVYSNITLQHIAPELTEVYLAEFIRVLSDGGVLLFQLPAGRRDEGAEWDRRGIGRKLRHLARSPLRGSRLAVDTLLGRTMEMHWIPRPAVVATLESAGGRVLDVQANESAGPDFESYRYAVARA
jgi:SAM-dependent methyltransferase